VWVRSHVMSIADRLGESSQRSSAIAGQFRSVQHHGNAIQECNSKLRKSIWARIRDEFDLGRLEGKQSKAYVVT